MSNCNTIELWPLPGLVEIKEDEEEVRKQREKYKQLEQKVTHTTHRMLEALGKAIPEISKSMKSALEAGKLDEKEMENVQKLREEINKKLKSTKTQARLREHHEIAEGFLVKRRYCVAEAEEKGNQNNQEKSIKTGISDYISNNDECIQFADVPGFTFAVSLDPFEEMIVPRTPNLKGTVKCAYGSCNKHITLSIETNDRQLCEQHKEKVLTFITESLVGTDIEESNFDFSELNRNLYGVCKYKIDQQLILVEKTLSEHDVAREACINTLLLLKTSIVLYRRYLNPDWIKVGNSILGISNWIIANIAVLSQAGKCTTDALSPPACAIYHWAATFFPTVFAFFHVNLVALLSPCAPMVGGPAITGASTFIALALIVALVSLVLFAMWKVVIKIAERILGPPDGGASFAAPPIMVGPGDKPHEIIVAGPVDDDE